MSDERIITPGQGQENSLRLLPELTLNDEDAAKVQELHALAYQQNVTWVGRRKNTGFRYVYEGPKNKNDLYNVSVIIEGEDLANNLTIVVFNKDEGRDTALDLKKSDGKWQVADVRGKYDYKGSSLQRSTNKQVTANDALRLLDITMRAAYPDRYPKIEENPLFENQEKRQLFEEDANKAEAMYEFVMQQPGYAREHRYDFRVGNKRYILEAPEVKGGNLSIHEIVYKQSSFGSDEYEASKEAVILNRGRQKTLRSIRGVRGEEKLPAPWYYRESTSDGWAFEEVWTDYQSPREGMGLFQEAYRHFETHLASIQQP